MTSSTTITTGLGSLSTLQEDEIYLNILEMSFRPCNVDLNQFTGNIRAVVSPSLDTNAFGPSKDMKQMSGFALANVISRNGALVRLAIYGGTTKLFDENIILASINSINWSRFVRVDFKYHRTQALCFPKFFPIQPGHRRGNFFLAKGYGPSILYPTMPILEFFWDTLYLTINSMSPDEHQKQLSDLRPSARDPRPCIHKHLGCHCAVTGLQPVRIQAGVTGSIFSYE
ncbi:hypothetical protein IFR04_005894 [Cadophora malorum]|uniref:Uncharacterized protein n=1 Tax=Cadophora malorum TaxID=108018 RepID=A0A8H7TKJ4_9HELO|nr:hypothetical protein IFR04_005894 [Cadophora malorum]